jgi:hypothetical protein
MSRCCQSYQRPVASCGLGLGTGIGTGNCCCSLPTLIILILIVLQFGKKDKDCRHEEGKLVDNGILFIIALFYLSCCGAKC